jgi:hypothetical protein
MLPRLHQARPSSGCARRRAPQSSPALGAARAGGTRVSPICRPRRRSGQTAQFAPDGRYARSCGGHLRGRISHPYRCPARAAVLPRCTRPVSRQPKNRGLIRARKVGRRPAAGALRGRRSDANGLELEHASLGPFPHLDDAAPEDAAPDHAGLCRIRPGLSELSRPGEPHRGQGAGNRQLVAAYTVCIQGFNEGSGGARGDIRELRS